MPNLDGVTCPFCHRGKLSESVRLQKYDYHGQSTEIEQPGLYCSQCDEAILEAKHLKVSRKALQTFRANIDGLLAPSEIKEIRMKIGLNQKQAGELFGGGKNAFSRYEQGEVAPPKSVSLLLSIINKHPELKSEILSL